MFEFSVFDLSGAHPCTLAWQVGPPDGPPDAPTEGLLNLGNTWVGYAKWIALVAGVLGLIVCGIMMMIGRRNRSAYAAEGAAGIPWVVAGLSLVFLAAGIVGELMNVGS